MHKLKQKFVLYGLLTLALVIVVFSVANNPSLIAYAKDETWIAKQVKDIVASTLRLIYNVFVEPILFPAIKSLLHFGIKQQDFLLNQFSGINALRGFLLGIANGIYLLTLFIASIAIILRINTGVYNIKKFLGGFVTAVMLSNLSLYIIRAILSIGTVIVQLLFKLAGDLHLQATSPDQLWQFLISLSQQPPGTGDAAIITFVFTIALVWFLIKIGLVLLERGIRLFVLAITAPIIFALSLLPNFQKTANKWWEDVIKWTLILPVVLGLIVLALYMLSFAGIKTNAQAQGLGNTLYNLLILQLEWQGAAAIDVDVQQIVFILLGLFSLWTAGMMNKYFNLGAVAAGFVETPQKALQTGQGLYKKAADNLTGKAGPSKLIADTFSGKNILGKATKAGWGEFGNTKKGQELEAWRQSQQGLMGGIFNREGEAARKKADRERGTSEALHNRISNRYANANNILNAAANEVAPGKTWDDPDLTDDQKNTARKAGGKRLANAEKIYKGDPKWITWSANKQAKEMDVHQMDSTTDMISKINGHASKGETGQANLLLAQLKKKLSSPGVSSDEKEQIRNWIDNEGGHELSKRSGYTMQKSTGQKADTTDSSSYTDLLRLQGQQTANEAALDTAGVHLSSQDKTALIGGNHGAGVIDKTALQNLNNGLSSATAAQLTSLTSDPTALSALKTALTNNDFKKAQSILAGKGITDKNDQNTIINSAKTMKAADLGLQLKLVASAREVGGNPDTNLATLADTIKKLQTTKQTIDQVQQNQVNIRNNSTASYNTAINNSISGGGANIHNPTTGNDISATTRAAVSTATDAWKTQLQTLLTNNPTMQGNNTLAQIQSSAGAVGLDVTKLVSTLKNLGLGADINGGEISIDESLKRLNIVHPS